MRKKVYVVVESVVSCGNDVIEVKVEFQCLVLVEGGEIWLLVVVLVVACEGDDEEFGDVSLKEMLW